MAAAAFSGTLVGKGAVTGKDYYVDLYASDVAAALVNFGSLGGAASSTSATSYQAAEPIRFNDLVLLVGGTDTNKLEFEVNGQSINKIVVNDAFLASIQTRVFRLNLNAGSVLRIYQRA